MSGFNDQVIAEFRGNNGYVTTAGFGDSLILLHSRGARTGEPRVGPVMALPDGDGWLIAASKAGAPDHPGWYYNLRAHPETVVEVPGDDAVRAVSVTSTELVGEERDAAWRRFTTRSAGFAKYEATAGDRVIPVLRLVPSPTPRR
jgi:deazaflavin-dependent oxidoreductase (nitroreductase family)